MLLAIVVATSFLNLPSISGKWNFFATESSEVVVTGTITISPQSHSGPAGLRGVKHLKYSEHAKGWMKEFDSREINGTLTGKSVYLSLYGIDDNDIYLNGTLKSDQVKGMWVHSTFAGHREHGSFTMTRAK